MAMTTSNKRQLSNGSADGNVLGQSETDLIAFYGATPVAQRSGSAQAAVTTTTATTTSPWGFATSAQANAVITLVNELRATLVQNGMIAGA
ncbi:MAG TPA: hypothetical protein VFW46_14820 [Stellaceae bacterium]|nr:hypothetical protein [Stellaceae bacterium]